MYLKIIVLFFKGAGKMRESHHRIRDAVVDHYIKEHPSDFERQADSQFSFVYNGNFTLLLALLVYGRPYSNVLLPWYPRRAAYPRFD